MRAAQLKSGCRGDQNMVLVGHDDLQGRSAYQPSIHHHGTRWIAYIGHHGGVSINSITRRVENNGTSIVDVTNVAHPKYPFHIPGQPGSGEEHRCERSRVRSGSLRLNVRFERQRAIEMFAVSLNINHDWPDTFFENELVPIAGARMAAHDKGARSPTLGCPANGSSDRGVKIRTRRLFLLLSGGRTNVVSPKLNSRAIFCIPSAVIPDASGKTANWLPPSADWLNTSTGQNQPEWREPRLAARKPDLEA
jgi:hypothetical protein